MFDWLRRLFASEEIPIPDPVDDPRLGRLVYHPDSDEWVGSFEYAGAPVEISLYGSLTEPDPEEAEHCARVIEAFDEVWEQAEELIRTQGPKFKAGDPDEFRPSSVCNFYQKERKTYFMMFLEREDDPYRLWRMEYVDWKATDLGFDS